MATPFTDVYTKFNTITEDAKLFGLLTDDELEDLLEIFLSKSRTVYFKNCLVDLTDINTTTKQFNQTVDEQSQWILAEGMKLTWLERKLYAEENLRGKISNKDYSYHSEGNLIDNLNELVKSTKVSIRDLTVSYSFDSFEGFN